MQTSRQETLTQQTGKGKPADKRKPTDRPRMLTDSEWVYYTIATNQIIPYEPKEHEYLRGGLNAAVNTAQVFAPLAAHRMRKAFTKLTEILIARGPLSQEELDEILLAAVDYCEPEVRGAGVDGR